jgi:outer membrane protein OmpA-like peptidoglycan-associated protein
MQHQARTRRAAPRRGWRSGYGGHRRVTAYYYPGHATRSGHHQYQGSCQERHTERGRHHTDLCRGIGGTAPPTLSFTLYFFEKSTRIVPGSRATLAALLAEVARRQAVEVQVTGHTDRVGTVQDNDRLSAERAETIRDVLIQHGLRANFVRAVGRGEREPLILTPDEQDEPRNRRVEVIVR